MSTIIDQLTDLFAKLPGIGPRQARRFVYYLLKERGGVGARMSHLISQLKSEVSQCKECYRFHVDKSCRICVDPNRSQTSLMVVLNDADLESIERAHVHDGQVFVLGGYVSLLEDEKTGKPKYARLTELTARIGKMHQLTEIILAFAANQDGDHTAYYLRDYLMQPGLTITTLGRGLSTGSELEYADADTIKSALLGRH